ncbi:TetR/AcrR family transcriptional regulator [Photobacterium gaetbulicola]|uniref:Putative LuxT regulator n=1 Tax=Photobacterium gaetbulicola Gung47 TaxID=658445 RepID=A0A0C5WG00_9GAMM|nr:TetR/AcrR family transcriptional regulator [Photobacterium gaetbulicola]AJR05117.1 putative LuxT regulator [Photobacterium gaetbulicola Gung47]PSU06856.1 TetR/AcrR family transcriptional regulator [Photobacterium gaetbulicola]
MAKVTPEEALKTRQRILDAVIQCLLDPQVGYEKMTYTRLQTMTGISRGGILNHFGKKEHFLLALDGRIFNTVLNELDLSSRDAFSSSFESALARPTFNAVMQLLLNNASHHVAIEYAKQAWRDLEDLIEEKLGAEVKENDLPRLLGRSIFMLTTSKAA